MQDSAGVLIVFDADPSISSGDDRMDRGVIGTVLGKVDVVAADWHVDGNGGVAYPTFNPVPFHEVSALYFVWFHEDAVDLNDDTGDQEVLRFNFWARRDS